jgi:V/A-type H+-transporting ATPase subunit A
VSEARITWIGGPVLRARMTGAFSVYEAVSVGPRRLLGEVIQLKGEELVAQVYEDTTGLEPGDNVSGTGRALSVQLGPGLLGGIFDGLLRPLTGTDDFQIQAGLGTGTGGRFRFVPAAATGADLAAGATLGTVMAAREQPILVPPGLAGRLDWLAAEGEYG